jgi:molybdenum cofactor guanylyltransferase
MSPGSLDVVVLAGGQGRRMGTDKALLRYQGQRLVDRAVATLSATIDRVIVARGDRPLGLPREVADAPGCPGPLGGVVAGLEAAGSDFVAFVPVDAPVVLPELARHLAARCQATGRAAAVPVVDGHVQALHAVIDRRALAAVLSRVAGGERSPRQLLAWLDALRVDVDGWSSIDPSGAFRQDWDHPDDLPPGVPAGLMGSGGVGRPGPQGTLHQVALFEEHPTKRWRDVVPLQHRRGPVEHVPGHGRVRVHVLGELDRPLLRTVPPDAVQDIEVGGDVRRQQVGLRELLEASPDVARLRVRQGRVLQQSVPGRPLLLRVRQGCPRRERMAFPDVGPVAFQFRAIAVRARWRLPGRAPSPDASAVPCPPPGHRPPRSRPEGSARGPGGHQDARRWPTGAPTPPVRQSRRQRLPTAPGRGRPGELAGHPDAQGPRNARPRPTRASPVVGRRRRRIPGRRC